MASHLSMEERKRLSTLREQGFSRAAVGRALGRAGSTITRELARNRRGWWYCPQQAQRRAERRRRQRPLQRKMDCPAIAAQVKRGLKAYHSPDQIAGRMKRLISDPERRVSARTIYRWIRQQPPGTWECYCGATDVENGAENRVPSPAWWRSRAVRRKPTSGASSGIGRATPWWVRAMTAAW